MVTKSLNNVWTAGYFQDTGTCFFVHSNCKVPIMVSTDTNAPISNDFRCPQCGIEVPKKFRDLVDEKEPINIQIGKHWFISNKYMRSRVDLVHECPWWKHLPDEWLRWGTRRQTWTAHGPWHDTYTRCIGCDTKIPDDVLFIYKMYMLNI